MNVRLWMLLLVCLILQGCNAFDPPPPVIIHPSPKEWADAVSQLKPEEQLRISQKLRVKFKLGDELDRNVYDWYYYDEGRLKSMPGGWTVNYSLIQYFNEKYSSDAAVEYAIVESLSFAQPGVISHHQHTTTMLRYGLVRESGEVVAAVSYGESIMFNIFTDGGYDKETEAHNVSYANAFLKMALDLDLHVRAGSQTKQPGMNPQANHNP